MKFLKIFCGGIGLMCHLPLGFTKKYDIPIRHLLCFRYSHPRRPDHGDHFNELLWNLAASQAG